MPDATQPNQPSPDDVKAMIDQFMNQSNQARTQMTQSSADTQMGQIEAMKQAMQILQEAGVNPADPASLQKFLQDLEQTEPDAAELLRSALQSIFPESTPQ